MPQFAMIFPGQGSRHIGMLSELASENNLIEQTFSEASFILGYDVWAMIQEGPESKLNQTEYTQPAILAASIATWRCWKAHQGPIPELLAGHSLGEYSALVVAESLTFEDALQLVAKRGRYMQQAVSNEEGAMAAIVGFDSNQITELCETARQGQEILSPANFNSIGQTVIAGHKVAVDRAVSMALNLGAKLAKHIPVSVPSHCALMQPAAELLSADLISINFMKPKIPILHNFDVLSHTGSDSIRQILIEQLIHPVRWVEIIQAMEQNGISLAVECGPGKVLTGLNKRISRVITTYPCADLISFNQALADAKTKK